MMAQTSPARLRRHAVEVRYSWGLSRYVSIMKLRYAKYLGERGKVSVLTAAPPAPGGMGKGWVGVWPHISGVLDLFLPLKNSGRARRSMAWTLQDETLREGLAWQPRMAWLVPCGIILILSCPVPVVVKPGGVAGDDDVVGLLRHVVLVQVGVLGLLPFAASSVLLLILPETSTTRAWGF